MITVPAYFNQAERRAVLHAAQMADLKVLQLISDNTAVALNYGVFRRKDINTTAQVLEAGEGVREGVCLFSVIALLSECIEGVVAKGTGASRQFDEGILRFSPLACGASSNFCPLPCRTSCSTTWEPAAQCAPL